MPYTLLFFNVIGTAGSFPRVTLLVLATVLFYGFLFLKVRLDAEAQDLPLLDEAKIVENQAKECLGERDFARRLYNFEQEMGDDFEKALNLLANSSEPEVRLIGFCWLNRKYPSNIPISRLRLELEKLKSKRTS